MWQWADYYIMLFKLFFKFYSPFKFRLMENNFISSDLSNKEHSCKNSSYVNDLPFAFYFHNNIITFALKYPFCLMVNDKRHALFPVFRAMLTVFICYFTFFVVPFALRWLKIFEGFLDLYKCPKLIVEI